MSKEKQIEEMAEVLRHSCDNECYKNKDGFTDCEICEACLLYEAGYRKQSDVIDEFAKRLKEAPIKCGLPLFGLSTKDEIVEYFNDIMLQVRDAIDSIAQEMKGGAE